MDFVKFELKEHIAVITLNKGPLNAFNLQMYSEVEDTFKAVNKNAAVWVAIFNAEGKFFSVGNDLNDFKGEYDLAYIRKIDAALKSVFDCKVPVIAAVQGAAIGGGFTMVSASDIVIAAKGTRFGIPEAKVGKVGGVTGASFSLPQKIVRYMSLTGEYMTAEELQPYGFIIKIVEQEDLLRTAYTIAEQIVCNPPLCVQYTKESLNRAYEKEYQLKKNPIDHENSLKIATTEDVKEAMAAFAEKRKPVYSLR